MFQFCNKHFEVLDFFSLMIYDNSVNCGWKKIQDFRECYSFVTNLGNTCNLSVFVVSLSYEVNGSIPILKIFRRNTTMRNFKKTLALVLAIVMVIGTFATVSAASTEKWYDKAVARLDAIGISNIGDTAGEYLSRNEFVMWIAKLESHNLIDEAWNDEIASVDFTDVTDAHHKAAIAYSYKANFIVGNGDGTFAPDKTLSLAEASAVIVRMMGYESKVDGNAEDWDKNWDMNYMRAAEKFCGAFDQTFYKNTVTFNPDYQLKKGEAAYILASIMNFNGAATLNLTADGIDLGAYFAGMGGNISVSREEVYYISQIDRMSYGAAVSKVYLDIEGQSAEILSNEINLAKNVVLRAANSNKYIVIPASEFAKAVRVEIGLTPNRDELNEEPEINVYQYVNVGTMVNVKVDSALFTDTYTDPQNGQTYQVATLNKYTDMKNFDINSNSVIVDTILQLKSNYASLSNYFGYSIVGEGTTRTVDPWKPVLPAAYDASLVTSWTNISRDALTNEVIAATLNFKGVKYEYGTDIVGYTPDATDANKWVAMTADEATKTLINAAQGECYTVFNDVNGDGLYDTFVVYDSYAFAYSTMANVQPYDSANSSVNSGRTNTAVLTSISNGETLKDANGEEYSLSMHYRNIGSVIYNRTVGYPNSGGMACSDAYNLTAATTGKLQLVLTASNAHPAPTSVVGANCVPLYYTVVDLASFYTGIIEVVSAASETINGKEYYSASILCTDGVSRDVYIPVEATEKVKLDVEIGGASAEYTFDASQWFTFISDDVKNAATQNGIFQTGNVKDDAYLAWAAAWMAGKYVEFAIDENDMVICILGTDKSTGTKGFVTNVEQAASGDNSYNVTIAALKTVKYTTATKYFHKTENPLTYTELAAKIHNSSALNYAKTLTGPTVVRNGVTYYETKYGDTRNTSRKLYADSNPITNETTFVFLYNGTTAVGPYDADGYAVIYDGTRFVDEVYYDTYTSVNNFVTKEVRATASGIFDWKNYAVYNQLFAGSLIDPNVTADAKVNAGTDLIYVELMQDGGSFYVKYDPTTESITNVNKIKDTSEMASNPTNSWAGKIYKSTFAATYSAASSWRDIEEGYFLSLDEIAGTRVYTQDAYGNDNGYTAQYNARVGFGPYYDRTWNATAKTYTYEIGFTEVVTYENFTGTAEAIIDTQKTLMIPVYVGGTGLDSVQVVVKTEADKAKYTLAEGYYVDEDNKVFLLLEKNGAVEVVYKKDAETGALVTKPIDYDYTTAASQSVLNDVLFTDEATLGLEEDLAPYATVTVVDKPKTDDGWFPGSYYMVIDGVNYNVTSATNVLVITPSANGFTAVSKSVESIKNSNGLFVTEWNAVINAGNVLETIVLLGQNAGATAKPTEPSTPEEDKTRVVFLDNSAKAYIKQDRYSNDWLVISDKAAFELPSGEDVGVIYRRYTTYKDANNDITIDLGVEGGKWYVIDENNMIVSEANVKILNGTVTDTQANGTTIATLNGEKNIVISDMATEFVYFDEAGNLKVAGDNTDVKIITKDAYAAQFTTLEKNVTDTKADFDAAQVKYDEGRLSEARYNHYKEAYEAAVKALADKKAANLNTYFNGQFWGFANSPLYKNFATAQGVFQEGKPTLNFEYVIVDDTLCVFTDSFSFGG